MFVIYKVSGKKRRSWFLPEQKDFYTQYGVIPKKDVRPGRVVLDGETFVIVPATYSDRVHAMPRGAQIITRKDIGMIMAYCGIGKDSVVVEAGAGSGGATVMLANVCKSVYSYDTRNDHLKTVRKNLKRLDIENVTLREGDISGPIDVRDADMVLLDVPEPWTAIPTAANATKPGGYIVAYTPTIVQAQEFVRHLPETVFHERTMELIDRDWNVTGRAVRPANASIGHTAFLTFCRRL